MAPLVDFRLDASSGTPTYLQIVHQVEQSLRLGYLEVGDQLPRVREVVERLAINPNTVHKAYRELEHRGLVVGRPGLGTFVVGSLSRVGLREQARFRRSLMQWMRAAAAAGIDEQGMVALFNSVLSDLTLDIAARDSADRSAAVPGSRRGKDGDVEAIA